MCLTRPQEKTTTFTNFFFGRQHTLLSYVSSFYQFFSIDDPNILIGRGEVTFLVVTARGKQHNRWILVFCAATNHDNTG